MDSGSSVILLSDSGDDSESLVSTITISSETQRVPVSWGSGNLDKASTKKPQVLEFEQTPNHSEKVKAWMNSCKYDDKDCEYRDNNKQDNKSTCIRYDFDKTPKTSCLAVPKSSFTRATPLVSYMEEAKKTTKPTSSESKLNGNKVKNDINCTPLRTESQKKELCNYLQLMKPEDKQYDFLMEYRRSTRVRIQQGETKEKEKDVVELSDGENVKNDINYPTLKSCGDLNMKMNKIKVFDLKRKKEDKVNTLLPLPPKRVYCEVSDFDDCIKEFVEDEKVKKRNGSFKKVEKRRRFNFRPKLPQSFKNIFSYKRINSLRSKGRLKNTSMDNLLLRKQQKRRKARKKLRMELQENERKERIKKNNESPRCEIISIHTNSDDDVDLKNFVDDMLELDKMSEEHRKSVIESRILASSSITNLINKKTSREDVQRAYKIFSDLSNDKKNWEEKENENENVEIDNENVEDENTATADNLVPDLIVCEHDYANFNTSCPEEDEEESVTNSLSPVPIPDLQVLPVSKEVVVKSLHRSLTLNKRKLYLNNYWNSSSNNNKKVNHSISISKKNGIFLRAFYQDFNLIIAQQNLISFWTQSALGNVLGAQNMWIPKDEIQRITLNSTYVQKDAMDMVITTETSVAYVELWTKEHKSDVREVPVADVFATVYFWRLRQTGLDKKALQLENIKGFADDVQYCVLKSYPKIIVSWHSVQGLEKKTKIHSYHLAADFQTVANISEIQPVEHYVSSLHNIEDCDSLVMGCGENKVTLWNVEYGYIVATIEMSSIKSPLSTLWVKCDRGFLFTIQECSDRELRLIAINGMNHSWKKLQSYNPQSGFDRLKGVCIENGILVAYYSEGILCWNAQTGELIVEEVANECEYIPSGKHVIMIVNENIIVRHSLSHLITDL